MIELFDILRLGGDAPVDCGDDALSERFGLVWDEDLLVFQGRYFSVISAVDHEGPRAGEEYWLLSEAESGLMISPEPLYTMWAVWSLLNHWCKALEKGHGLV